MLACVPGLVSFDVHAEDSLHEEFEGRVLKENSRRYLTVTLENDLFGKGTDQNYTNGFRVGWFDAGRKPPGITEDLEDYLPFLDVNETTSVSYSLGHNIYTPDNVESPAQDPEDRPWAAFLYGSMGMLTVSEAYLDEYEITLGVVGPVAQGEPIQKFAHDIVGSPKPRGWDNQLNNEPAVMLSWQRRWPTFLHGDLSGTNLSLAPHFGLTAGNVYTYANTGATFKLSSEGERWVDKPLMVRPSIPGIGFFPRTNKFYWEVFLAVEMRAIARNIFLDGNTFSDSHSIDKKNFVGDVSAGVTLTWRSFRMGYTLVYRTREFVGQDEPDLFGAINLGLVF